MNLRERLISSLHGKAPDRIPWIIRAPRLLMPRGTVERELRNAGCGLLMRERPYAIETPHVKVEEVQRWKNGNWTTVRTYKTPMGNVSEKKAQSEAYLYSHDVFTEHVIKGPSDYPIVKFIIQDTLYRPCYQKLVQMQEFLGDDGVLMGLLDYSPFEKLVVDLMGIERLSLDLYDCPDRVEELLDCMEKKQNEMYQIATDAPVEVIEGAGNVTSELLSPIWFEKYCLPFYNRQASGLHRKGKLYMIHMDGNLKALANLIARSDVDIIDSFNPPPMGDLPLNQARKAWKNKIIMMNFPASICWQGKEMIEKFVRESLIEAAPGDRFVLGIMEDIPQEIWAESLKTITLAMAKYGTYPVQI